MNPYTKYSKEELESMIAEKESKNNPYDNYSKEELRSMISKREGLGERSLGMSAARQAARVGRSAATGIAGLADIPNLAALGLHAAGLKERPTFYKPLGERTQEWIDEKTHGQLKPENKFEEYMDVGGESVAPLLLAPFTGGTSLAATGARNVAKATGNKIASKVASKLGKTNPYAFTGANASGSLGASAGSKYYIDNTDKPGVIGSLVAGSIGGSGGRRLYNSPKTLLSPGDSVSRFVAKTSKFNPEKYKNLKDLGIESSLSDVSDGRMSRRIENILSHAPGGSDVMEKFYDAKNNSLAHNVGLRSSEHAKHLSANPNHYLAKKGAEGFKEDISRKYAEKEKIFAPFEEAQRVGEIPVDVTDINEKLGRASRGLSRNAKNTYFNKTPEGEMQKSLTRLNRKDAALDPKMSNEVHINYADLDLLRNNATKAKEAAKSGTQESRQYSDIAHSLSGKRHQHIEKHGTPEQIQASKEARNLYWNYASKKGENLKEKVYSLIDADSDKSAFNKVTQNEKYTKVVYDGLPKADKKEFTQTLLSSLGRSGDSFNINTLHSKWNKLTKPVREEVLSNMGKQNRKRFEKTLDFIGKNKEDIAKTANTSHTAHATKNIEMLSKVGSGVASLATLNPIPLAAVFSGIGATNLGAKAMTNKRLLERMYKTSEKDKLNPRESMKNKTLSTLNKASVQANQQEKERDKKRRIIDVGKRKVFYE